MQNIDERILKWAQLRATAFTSAEAYEAIDFVQDIKEMSDRVRQLFAYGFLARKIDGVRYCYICVEFAPSDFDRCTTLKKPEIQEEKEAISVPGHPQKDEQKLTSIPSAKVEEPKIKAEKEILVSALSVQEGGAHYKDMPIQPIEYIHRNGLGYLEGNVVKYISRWRRKGGIEDLKKSRHYIDLLIELEGGSTNPGQSAGIPPCA